MISITYDGKQYTIYVTYSYFLIFSTNYYWTCKNRNDIKKFKWISDKTLLKKNLINVSEEVNYETNMSINDCIKYNNELQKFLLTK